MVNYKTILGVKLITLERKSQEVVIISPSSLLEGDNNDKKTKNIEKFYC